MDDKAALLDQLRIDRGGPAASSAKGRVWIGAAAAVLVALAGAWWWWSRPAPLGVHIAVARPSGGGGGETVQASVLDATGCVVARRLATVSSKITDKMVELDIEEGEHVKAGQIIAKLDDTNIRAQFDQAGAQLDFAKAGLAETEVNLANAQRDYDRQSRLLGEHYVSQAAVDNSATTLAALRAQLATQKTNITVAERGVAVAARNLSDTIVRAPFSGVVTVKAAQPGEIVSPISAGGGFTRTGIGTIVDMDSLEVQVDVNENFINRVQPLQPVSAKLNAYPDWRIPAHVIAVIPTADRSKGTVTVRIALEQKDPRILPEMGVHVSFLEHPAAAAGGGAAVAEVRLPSNAVDGTGATGTVFVVHQNTVERRAVRLGAVSGDGVDVLSGVAAGDRVAVGDFTKLKDGAIIRIIP